jgi:hypothetical protein
MKMRLFLFSGLLAGSVGLSLLFASTTHAAGETYKWIDATTVEGSGGAYDSKIMKSNAFGTTSQPTPIKTVKFVREGTTNKFKATSSDIFYVTQGGALTGAGKCMLQLSLNVNAVDKADLSVNDGALTQQCTQSTLDSSVGIGATASGPDAASLVQAPAQGATSSDSASSCRIEGIGWILCPVLRTMAGLVDGAYGLVSSLLKISPIVAGEEDASKSIYGAWSVMRNFANVAFVIAFLIIIFSQLTSVGLNNYGIKKMLPRLIVAAILVNASFWICAIAVDISNILGSSLNELMRGIPTQDAKNATQIDAASTGTGWVGVTGGVLAATAITIPILYATLSALLPALVAALAAIVTVFLVLTLRQALVILLIVVSPLAFVAYLLPNTESLFKKWLSLFKTLLLMYPIIALIFGSSALASKIIMNTAAEGDSPYKVAIQIMGALVAIVPLAITPVVMKTAGGLLNRFGGMVNNPNKGPFDKLRKKAEGYRDFRQGLARGRRIDRAKRFRNGELFNGRVGNKLFGDASTAAGKADRAAASRIFGGAYEANQRDRSRKDRLNAYESEAEQTYNESAAGQKYATAAIQAKNRAGTASTNITALAEETTLRSDLNASRDAKDRQTIAQTQNETFAESNREVGTAIKLALAKSDLEKAKKHEEVEIEQIKANRAVLTGEAAVNADALRSSVQATKVASSQIDSAQRVQAATFNEAVTATGSTLAAQMGGVDKYGEQRAKAISTTALHKAYDDAVTAERATLSKTVVATANAQPGEKSLEAIYQDANESVERRAAAASMVIKNGGDGDIIKAFDYLAQKPLDPTVDPAKQMEAFSTIQQQFAADIGQRKPTSIGAASMSDMARGKYTGTFEGEVVNRAAKGKLNAEALARTSADELGDMATIYSANLAAIPAAERQALSESIYKFRNDPLNAGKQPSHEIGAKMDAIESLLRGNNPVPTVNQQGPRANQQTPAAGGAGTLNIPHTPQPAPQQQAYANPTAGRTSMPPNTSNFPSTPNGPGGLYVPSGYQQQPPNNPPQGPPPNTP